jgi:transposase
MNNPITRSVLRPTINPIYEIFEKNIGIEFPLYINDVQYDKNNFIYNIFVVFHKKALFTCSECGTENLKVIHKRPRIFKGLDIFNNETLIHIDLPILLCPKCGKRITYTPKWATKNSGLTVQLQHRILAEATIMPISDITKRTGLKTHRVSNVIKRYVDEAVTNDDWSEVKIIGIDEKAIRKGHDYITVFVDQEKNRFLYAVEGKGMSTIENFCSQLLLHNSTPDNITEVAIDMSPSYISGVLDYFKNAHITFDKFHVMKIANETVDQIRREEVHSQPVLKGARYALLKNEKKLSEKEKAQICRFSAMRLKTGRAYRYKSLLSELYGNVTSVEEAEASIRSLINWGRKSRLEPLKLFANTLSTHLDGILRYFCTGLTSGFVEGMNSRIQEIKRRARGYPNTNNLINMLHLCLGKLPIPKLFGKGLPTFS